MNKNIKLLWFANTTALFGTSIYQFILVILSLEVTETSLGAGMTLFFITMPYFFLGLIGEELQINLTRKK